MNELQVNQFSYNFDNGQVTSAQVGLYGAINGDREFVNASIRVKQTDLPEGKNFMQAAMSDMITIARKKLAADTAVKEAQTTTQQDNNQ